MNCCYEEPETEKVNNLVIIDQSDCPFKQFFPWCPLIKLFPRCMDLYRPMVDIVVVTARMAKRRVEEEGGLAILKCEDRIPSWVCHPPRTTSLDMDLNIPGY